ncbi:S8 family serine peptidase [Bacillus salinus]|uniref:S8 family serine peptidase n=1 Tax=Bacillus sp. HMF5848 TaxID=2495421 RepID=UPI0021AE1AFE|nr:S8 family serine peptidase [Bacillus sp. HMF5848]
MRKNLAVLLTFLMVFSNAMFGSSAFANSGNTSLPERENLKEKLLTQTFEDSDEVRVIVELEGEAPIDFATRQKTLYKDLSESTKASLESEAAKKSEDALNTLKAENIDIQVENVYTAIANGFSGSVKFGDIERIKQIPQVKNVYISNQYERPQPEPDMTESHAFVQSTQTWGDAQYKGEGTIVAVIDSGTDPFHKDFVITDLSASEGYLTQAEVEEKIAEHGLLGKYYSEKVPYAYNYYDKGHDIMDLGPSASMHGMHVAGTVAANGDPNNGGIQGVAPEAQVLGMKVFSNDPNYPSTWTDIYVVAIDEAIKLGADVINMSLGSTAAFVADDGLESVWITKAVENGLVVSVSAGNSGHIADGYGNPLAANPDIGVVGSPGLSKDTIQVAASGNYVYLYETPVVVKAVYEEVYEEAAASVDIELTDLNLEEAPASSETTYGETTVELTGYGADDWAEAFGSGEIELVTIGGKLGFPEDFEGVDVKDKVVLVQRGALAFIDKTQYAMEAGAAGIIVYDHGLAPFYKDQGNWALIPFMKISKADGQALEALFTEDTVSVNLSVDVDGVNSQEGPEVGKVTGFSSWGTTPSLELKPELTAPGGHIYSTFQKDTYGFMSGTSMAAPHVAGGSALVIQYLKEEFPGLSSEERARLAKVLLMNTGKIITHEDGTPFSPRQQGAGMMQTYNAVSTPVTVVDPSTNEAKVELFEIADSATTFTLEAENHTDQAVTYKVDTTVLKDMVVTAGGVEYNALQSEVIDATVNVSGSNVDGDYITVPANGSTTFVVTVSFDGLVEVDNFVEGFVTLTHETKPDLSVPFLSFYGDWDRPAILDGDPTVDGDSVFYDLDWAYGLGPWSRFFDDAWFSMPNPENQYVLSPNGDGFNDVLDPFFTFLRNAKEVEYNILASDGKKLRTLVKQEDVRKNYFDAGNGDLYYFIDGGLWDGSVRFAPVAEGDYFYEVKATVDFPGAEAQFVRYPIIVDVTAPAVDVTYDDATNTVMWTATEEGSGISYFEVLENGESVAQLDADATSYTLPAGAEEVVVDVVAVDYGYNVGGDTVVVNDNTIPTINVLSPAPFGTYNTKEVLVQGTVADGTLVTDITVNGKSVPVGFNPDLGEYVFSTTLTYEQDGKYEVLIGATDEQGNAIEIARHIFIDSTPGTITVNDAPQWVPGDQGSFELSVTLEDNYRQIDFYIDDNYEYGNPFNEPLVMDGFTETLTRTLDLKMGLNTFLLTLEDLGGNVTQEVVKVWRGEEPPTTGITSFTVEPSEYVSMNRPTVITAAANGAVEWNVTVTSPSDEVVAEWTSEGDTFTAEYAVDKYASNGLYTVTVNALDMNGELLDTDVKSFNVYNYSTMIESIDVLNGNGEAQSVFAEGDVANISATVKNLESTHIANPMLIIQVRDEDNRVVGKSFLTMSMLNADGSNGLGMELLLDGLAEGEYYIDVFVWTGWDMNPLSAASKGEVTFTIE